MIEKIFVKNYLPSQYVQAFGSNSSWVFACNYITMLLKGENYIAECSNDNIIRQKQLINNTSGDFNSMSQLLSLRNIILHNIMVSPDLNTKTDYFQQCINNGIPLILSRWNQVFVLAGYEATRTYSMCNINHFFIIDSGYYGNPSYLTLQDLNSIDFIGYPALSFNNNAALQNYYTN